MMSSDGRNRDIMEMMIELTTHEIIERAQGQDLSVIEMRIQRQQQLKTEEGQANAQEVLMTREAEREACTRKMYNDRAQNEEISIRRLEVLETLIGRH